MTDLEIARMAKKESILKVAEKLGLPGDCMVPYGEDKAKIHNFCGKSKGS